LARRGRRYRDRHRCEARGGVGAGAPDGVIRWKRAGAVEDLPAAHGSALYWMAIVLPLMVTEVLAGGLAGAPSFRPSSVPGRARKAVAAAISRTVVNARFMVWVVLF